MAAFDLEQYLAQGVRHILTGLTAAAGKNIKTAAFLARFAMAAQSAKHRRAQLAAAGEHIPPFLTPASQSVQSALPRLLRQSRRCLL